MTMSTAPAIQFPRVGCAGAASATRTNGTGSQLRFRNSTAPSRALALCSANEGAAVGPGGDWLGDIARKLIVDQRTQELAHDGVECRWALDIGQMARTL